MNQRHISSLGFTVHRVSNRTAPGVPRRARLRRLLTLSRSLAVTSLSALLAAASGCALVGYDLSDYGPEGAKSADGGGGSGTGAQVGQGGQGGGLGSKTEVPSGQGSPSASSSSGGTVLGK